MKVLETLADDTVVILQIHKRVWPASQRDALFWSHIRRAQDDVAGDGDAPDARRTPRDTWIVCNHSTQHPEAPQVRSKCEPEGLPSYLIGFSHLLTRQSFSLSLSLVGTQQNDGKMVRVSLTVSLVCQTFVERPNDGGPVTRDHLTCRITYCSVVNPGGWVTATNLASSFPVLRDVDTDVPSSWPAAVPGAHLGVAGRVPARVPQVPQTLHALRPGPLPRPADPLLNRQLGPSPRRRHHITTRHSSCPPCLGPFTQSRLYVPRGFQSVFPFRPAFESVFCFGWFLFFFRALRRRSSSLSEATNKCSVFKSEPWLSSCL